MMNNTFFQERMILGQRRELAEYPCRLPHDQPYKAQRDTEIEEVQGYMVGGDMLAREHHLEEIQPVSKDQKYGHKCYRAPVAFGTAFHEDKQRAHEIDYQVQVEDACVSPVK